MRTAQFGLSLPPNAANSQDLRELTRLADALGLDLLGIQAHGVAVLRHHEPDRGAPC